MLFLNRLNRVRRSPGTPKHPARSRSGSCRLDLELLERREMLDGSSFVKLISDHNAAQLLTLSDIGIQVASALVGVFANDSPEKVLVRNGFLQDVIREGYQNLGSLLNTQIQKSDPRQENPAINDAAADSARDAEFDLYNYKLSGDQKYLALAAHESSLATAFVEQQTDPFYIGGLICAGNARIDVFRALEPDWVHDSALVGEVNQMIKSLAGMIGTVQKSVESAHTVAPGSEFIDLGPTFKPPGYTDYFFSHFDKGHEISRFLYDTVPATYRGGRKYYTRNGAEAAAEQDRLVGISNELTFLSIAKFKQIVEIWKDLTDTLVLTVPEQTTAGLPFDLIVTAVDGKGNVDTTYAGTVVLTSSDPSGQLPATYSFMAGRFTFSGAALVTAGSQSITASDTGRGIVGTATVPVTPAPANHFALTAPAEVTTGMPFDLTVTALDPYGNTDTNYQGTVDFTTSDTDPGVALPADYTFQASDQGTQTFAGAFTLITTGVQTLTATDTANAALAGSASIAVTAVSPLPPGAVNLSLFAADASAVIVGSGTSDVGGAKTVPLDARPVDRFFARPEQDVDRSADCLHDYAALAWANKGLSTRVAEELAAIVRQGATVNP
jgi:hypothetical protein